MSKNFIKKIKTIVFKKNMSMNVKKFNKYTKEKYNIYYLKIYISVKYVF